MSTDHDELHSHMAPQDVYAHLQRDHQFRPLMSPWAAGLPSAAEDLPRWAATYLQRHQVDTSGYTQQEVQAVALHMWDHDNHYALGSVHSAESLEWGYGPIGDNPSVIRPCTRKGEALDEAADNHVSVWSRPANPHPWTLSDSQPPAEDAHI